jgi:hypothetical protein
LSKVRIEGPPSLQLKLRELCEKFQHIFSEEVSPIPAKVDIPMSIKIDESQWYTSHNRHPPRQQSQIKQQEIEKQVSAMPT